MIVEKDSPILGEKVTSTEGSANSVQSALHRFMGVFHKHNEEHDLEKPSHAQVDAMPAVDSAHPVGFTELFR